MVPPNPSSTLPGHPWKSISYVMSKKLSTFQSLDGRELQHCAARAREAELRTGSESENTEIGIAEELSLHAEHFSGERLDRVPRSARTAVRLPLEQN